MCFDVGGIRVVSICRVVDLLVLFGLRKVMSFLCMVVKEMLVMVWIGVFLMVKILFRFLVLMRDLFMGVSV